MNLLKRLIVRVPLLGPLLVRLRQRWIEQGVIKDNLAALALAVAGLEPRALAVTGPAAMLTSRLCTQEQFGDPRYGEWCAKLGERPKWHRKQWEYFFICQALAERGLLAPDKRGLGFGVGEEPLAACFANAGASIVATDQERGRAEAAGWASTGQHADGLARLNRRGLCGATDFSRLVTFRTADMNAIAADLRDFDFTWSACALEHLGSLELGRRFVSASLRCLKPGGIAVHTTEFVLSSNQDTIERGVTVLYRRRDMEELAAGLTAAGHHVEPIDFTPGSGILDQIADTPPFRDEPHLRLLIGKHICTSIGLIIRRGR